MHPYPRSLAAHTNDLNNAYMQQTHPDKVVRRTFYVEVGRTFVGSYTSGPCVVCARTRHGHRHHPVSLPSRKKSVLYSNGTNHASKNHSSTHCYCMELLAKCSIYMKMEPNPAYNLFCGEIFSVRFLLLPLIFLFSFGKKKEKTKTIPCYNTPFRLSIVRLLQSFSLRC